MKKIILLFKLLKYINSLENYKNLSINDIINSIYRKGYDDGRYFPYEFNLNNLFKNKK